MKITLEPTTLVCRFAASDCISVRVWQGETDQGTPVHVFVALLANPPTVEADEELQSGLDEARKTEIPSYLAAGDLVLDFDGTIVSIRPETTGRLQ